MTRDSQPFGGTHQTRPATHRDRRAESCKRRLHIRTNASYGLHDMKEIWTIKERYASDLFFRLGRQHVRPVPELRERRPQRPPFAAAQVDHRLAKIAQCRRELCTKRFGEIIRHLDAKTSYTRQLANIQGPAAVANWVRCQGGILFEQKTNFLGSAYETLEMSEQPWTVLLSQQSWANLCTANSC